MYITDILEQKHTTLSLEVFPPKQTAGFDTLKQSLKEMCSLPIDYVSVTYGAGGSTSKNTVSIADYISKEFNIPSLAHLTCINSTKESIHSILNSLKERDIDNILALRGDIPAGTDVSSDIYKHASDLMHDISDFGGFAIGGACYPECHPDSPDVDTDIDNLKRKIEAGCAFLVTQMFFDNNVFYEFRDKAVQKGINVPIITGIMPLTNIKQIQKMCILSGGAAMPSKFTKMIAKFSDNPDALRQAGISYAIDQITDLVSNDTRGIHIYTMNNPSTAKQIINSIDMLFKQ